MSENNKNLADIKDLSVSFMTDAGSIKAVEDVNFTIPRKTVVGVVGESGSGKSVTARSIIKLLPETATTSGAVYLSKRDGSDSLDVLSLSGEQLRQAVTLLTRAELTFKQDYGHDVWPELESLSLLLCHKALADVFIDG